MAQMAWLQCPFDCTLVQLHKFLTSNTLICAKWQILKQGYFYHFQGQQLSYIVYDSDA
jgi:hypothetical protein